MLAILPDEPKRLVYYWIWPDNVESEYLGTSTA